MLSVVAAALDATLLDSADELVGATELAGVELGASELAGVELGAIELAAVELGAGDGAGLLPPPPPPHAVKLSTIKGRAQVLIRDCMIIRILRCCYFELYGFLRWWVQFEWQFESAISTYHFIIVFLYKACGTNIVVLGSSVNVI